VIPVDDVRVRGHHHLAVSLEAEYADDRLDLERRDDQRDRSWARTRRVLLALGKLRHGHGMPEHQHVGVGRGPRARQRYRSASEGYSRDAPPHPLATSHADALASNL